MGREVIRRPLETLNDVPRGGTPGQTLVKTGAADYAMAWGAGSEDHVFNAADYGLDVDGSNENLEAILDTWEAAIAYGLASRTRYVELWTPVRPDPYIFGLGTTKGGASLGNAQLPIPVVDPDDRKLQIVLRGCLDAAGMPHWLQDLGQRWGVTWLSTLTGQTNDVTHGAPSVVGGPTPQHGYGSGTQEFSNVCVTVSGIGLSLPLNPTVSGWDFRGCAQMNFLNGSCIVDAAPADMNATATHDWVAGLYCPQNFNNDRNFIGDLSIYGTYYGCSLTEHLAAQRIACIYTQHGVFLQCDSDNIHSSWIGNLSVEACAGDVIQTAAASAHGGPWEISACSVETVGAAHVRDVNNGLSGRINFTKLDAPLGSASGLVVVGGGNLEIIAANQARGPVTAPAIPASGDGNAITNPFWRHANVYVNGGTVTAIKVGGTATGTTSGMVRVPSGKTISLTYSVVPTSWVWVLD